MTNPEIPKVICDECKKPVIELFNGRICVNCYVKICDKIFQQDQEYQDWRKKFLEEYEKESNK